MAAYEAATKSVCDLRENEGGSGGWERYWVTPVRHRWVFPPKHTMAKALSCRGNFAGEA